MFNSVQEFFDLERAEMLATMNPSALLTRAETVAKYLKEIIAEREEKETIGKALLVSRQNEFSRKLNTPQAQKTSLTSEQRQAKRYARCIDAGLKFSDNSFATLPRGIGKLAKSEGISQQAFSKDIRLYLARKR